MASATKHSATRPGASSQVTSSIASPFAETFGRYTSIHVNSPLPSSNPAWLAFLASRGAQVDAGHVAHFGQPREELLAARDALIVADLSHNALLAVSGDDATAFLHGQFTNDVQALPQGAAQWNGWLSPKGRLLATFLLVKRADGYLLML